MIAMALSCDPAVLIADEPTTALDVTIQAQIIELMNEMQARLGSAIILITHDLGVVAETCENVLVMYGGNMVEFGTATEIFEAPKMPYTMGLLESLPRLDQAGSRLIPIEGQPPNLLRMPPGCAFAPRCVIGCRSAPSRCRSTISETVTSRAASSTTRAPTGRNRSSREPPIVAGSAVAQTPPGVAR